MNRKAGSLNPSRYSDKTNGLGLGGNLDLTVAHVIANNPKKMKATMRMVQGKPTSGINFSIMMGMMNPPMEDPLTMIPNAAARLLKNQVTTLVMQALKHADDAMAAQMLCARKNW